MTACLMVLDLEQTVDWYRDRLGFTVLGQANGWAKVQYGETALELYERTAQEPETMAMTGQVRVACPDVNGVNTCDLEIVWGPERFDYGYRELAVLDCNGYRLVFSERI